MQNQPDKSLDNAANKKRFALAVIVAAVCIGSLLYALTLHSNAEIGNDQYSLILSLAINCERDDCDRITDALSDGRIDHQESTVIMLMKHVAEGVTEADAKDKLISLVTNDVRFRPRK